MKKITFYISIFLLLAVCFSTKAQTVVTFNATGAPQTFVVPPGVLNIDITARGAQGRRNFTGVAGGLGGQATGTLSVTPGETLTVYVGTGGDLGTAGGYNGGGAAGASACAQARGGGGGGASDVRRNAATLNDRVIVAAGGSGAAGNRLAGCGRGTGGGGGGGYYGGGGGAGWPFNSTTPSGTGGTQTAGGNGGTSTFTGAPGNNGAPGGFGFGGNGGNEISSNQAGTNTGSLGASGGGLTGATGTYAGSFTGASGGGGSSYIGGVTGGSTISGNWVGNGQVVFSYTVSDVTPPVVTCPGDFTVSNDLGQCDAVVTYTVTATDNLPGVTLVVTPPSGSTFPVGSTLVTATATDAAGNTATCTFNVTINDTEDPVVSCPADITVSNDPGQCSAVVTFTPTATDNCPGVTVSSVPASGSVFPVGTTLVTVTATDGAGNTDVCTFNVTVNDAEDPVITCPADISVNNDPGLCSGVVNFTISATDNCGSIGIANINPSKDNSLFAETPGNSNGAGQLMYVGQNGVDESHRGVLAFDVAATIPAGATITGVSLTMTADHPSANNGPQDFNLYRVLEDWGEGASDNGTAPGSGGGGFGVPAIAPDATWDDAMLGTPWAAGPGGTFNPASSAIQTVDTNGPYMWSSASLISDVQDMLDNPGTNFGWIIIGNETSGGGTTKRFGTRESSIPPVLNITYSVGAPLTLTQTAGLPSGSAFPVGTTTNTFVVTDPAGNSDTCSFDVTVTDNEPPVAVCQDITIQLDANGMASITAAQIDNGSTDNCGIASLSVSPSTFDCSNVGANTVTLTVTDTSGNSSTCTATVTVEDNVPPVAMCVPDFTLPLDAMGNASLTAMDIDNGSTDACGIASLSISPSTFDCSNVGPNTVTLTVTDVNGNVSTCTTVVTIVDNTPPQIVCPPDVNASNDAGICGAIVSFPDAIAIDECGIMSVTQTMGLPSGSVFPVGTTTIEFTATDVNGNTNTCTFDITVTDDEPPVAVCQDITIQLDDMGNATITPAQLDGGSTDNCGIASLSISQDTFDCSDVGPNNVVLTVTDIYGNSSTCTAVVTVEDVTPPVAVCMDITVELDVNGTVTVDPALVGGASTDACGIGSLALDIDTFTCADVGDNMVTLFVTDVNGNVSTCTAIITVEDNIAPDLVCMDITVELDENGFAEILPEDVIASNTDACGIFTSAVDIFEFDCDDIGAPITVTVFTIDVNGNISSCTAEVTVVDVLAPEVTCPEDQTVDPGAGNLFYEVPDYWASGEATATDNCTDPLTIFSQDPAPGTLLGDGTYTVTLCSTDEYGNEACCTFELTVESILGGADPSNFGTITLYPNPANSEVYLSNPKQMELEQVSIYDMTGRLIKTVNLEGMGAEKAIDISELASATYMFIINNEYGQMTKSIIKE